jgi:hypothetical protein
MLLPFGASEVLRAVDSWAGNMQELQPGQVDRMRDDSIGRGVFGACSVMGLHDYCVMRTDRFSTLAGRNAAMCRKTVR